MSTGEDRGGIYSVAVRKERETTAAKKQQHLHIEANQLSRVTHLSAWERSAVQRVQIRQRGRETAEAVDANGDNDASDALLMLRVAYVTVFPIRPGFLI